MVKKQFSRIKTNKFKLRMTINANNEDDPSEAFKYELSIYEQGLFASSALPMVASKASPADAMWDIVKESQPESAPASNVHYVIDGCALPVGYASRKYGYGIEILLCSMVMLMNQP